MNVTLFVSLISEAWDMQVRGIQKTEQGEWHKASSWETDVAVIVVVVINSLTLARSIIYYFCQQNSIKMCQMKV